MTRILPEETDASPQNRANPVAKLWRKTARSRLHFELAGLAFARQKGASSGEYAHYLWSRGASRWIGSFTPNAGEYLLKEAEAFRAFYPEVAFEVMEAAEEKAELIFTKGCLGGWGKDPWALARSLGLAKEDICDYCRQAFLVWAKQLGLVARIAPEDSGICRLQVVRPKAVSVYHQELPPAVGL